jgi:hypothetical protein
MRKILLLGLPCGLASAGTVFLLDTDFPGLRLFGYCIGLVMEGHCQGLRLGFYLGPGLIFGLAFGLALGLRRALPGFLLAALVANALAVMVSVNGLTALEHYLQPEWLAEAIVGLLAGAIGGGLLSLAASRLRPGLDWRRPLLFGAGLGLLLPVALEDDLGAVGLYIFYALWQGGYGAALLWRGR